MNKKQIIKSVISDIIQIDYEEISNEDYLIEDLGADELDIVNIIRRIEELLSIKIEEFILDDITVGDIFELFDDNTESTKALIKDFSFDDIQAPELKKTWNYFLDLNNQLSDDKRMTFGVMPWAHTKYVDSDPDVDLILYINNIYTNEINKCGNALYISNNKGGVLFIPEKQERLCSGSIIDITRLIRHPDLKDKQGSINPEYKNKLILDKFIIWNGDYDVNFEKDTSKGDAFIHYHYYKDWLGADVHGEFRLNEKNLKQLFTNLQNNENNMQKYLNRKFKLF